MDENITCEQYLSWYEGLGEQEKIEARNKLYEEYSDYLLKWIKSILQIKRVFKSQKEILSISFDCFLHAFEKCKFSPIPLKQHMFTYTRYKLKSILEDEKHQSVVELSVNETDYDMFNNEGVNLAIIDLKDFRSKLPNKYKDVFDDAVMGFDPDNRRRANRFNKVKEYIAYYRYCEAKKIFKYIIQWFLKGNIDEEV
jgi:hypothetical protein